jgi:hypothetical protein
VIFQATDLAQLRSVRLWLGSHVWRQIIVANAAAESHPTADRLRAQDRTPRAAGARVSKSFRWA